MIPMLILYLIRRFKSKFDLKKLRKFRKLKNASVFILTALLTLSTYASNQFKDTNESLLFHVIRNEKIIGSIHIKKTTNSQGTIYELESTIRAKYILKFNVTGLEKTVFRNGTLVYSSVFRKVNNKIKADHRTILEHDRYIVDEDNLKRALDLNLITQNLVLLYFQEPIGVNSVYCDNQLKMSEVQPVGDGEYKVVFPNGNHNVYYYRYGRCVKIEAVSKLFNVSLIPA